MRVANGSCRFKPDQGRLRHIVKGGLEAGTTGIPVRMWDGVYWDDCYHSEVAARYRPSRVGTRLMYLYLASDLRAWC
jgi:hypothetical protein